MRNIHTEILVIGGGATGTGILYDAARRGFKTILVERRDLAYGTTGRFHGLLHSGGRYAVKDPHAARECIEENRILRHILPHCIEDTGGFFVLTPEDDESYIDSFLAGCRAAGIPAEEVPISQMLAEEPLLNPGIRRCFRVPDGAADSFAAAHANVAAARAFGARVLTYHEVIGLLTADRRQQTAVIGARCHDLTRDEQVTIHADLVINAAGPWAGKIAATAGIEVNIRPGKGTMIALAHRPVHTVINRCKMPSDGDILVPAHTVAVMGTTDEYVPNPDSFAIEPWEIRLLLEEGEKLVPGFKQMRVLRAWAGVRPLYQETVSNGGDRDITRAFALLDHAARDGVDDLLTITGGKWTTYRRMAEVTVDLACEKLGTLRECSTHLEELPTMDRRQLTAAVSGPQSAVYFGHRLATIEAHHAQGELICECELVTRAQLEAAIRSGDAHTLDDLRRDLRLGMGPCQGGFCTLRAAGVLHETTADGGQQTAVGGPRSVMDTNAALRDFLEERWKGLLPVLWGSQLQQERLNALIYVNVLNIHALPGEKASRLAASPYVRPKGDSRQATADRGRKTADGRQRTAVSGQPSAVHRQPPNDLIVIGAGLSGLVAAWRAAERSLKVRVIARGWGATHWGAGCIDMLGYWPTGNTIPIENPAAALATLIAQAPNHPYARLGIAQIEAALQAFQELCAATGYPLEGSLTRNWLLPTALGVARPTCLAPLTMIHGDLRDPAPMLLVGFAGYNDFYPEFATANLRAQGISAEGVTLTLPSLERLRRVDAITLARRFEQPDFRAELAAALRPHVGAVERIGFPAVLGIEDPAGVQRELESVLGRRVFEMPGLPPSVPGMRLQRLLVEAIRALDGRVEVGAEVIGVLTPDSRQRSTGRGLPFAILTQAAARQVAHPAEYFILATGSFLGGGFTTDHNGYAQEAIFDLPIQDVPPQGEWFRRRFLAAQGHPLFEAGIAVDAEFHPVDENGKPICPNLAVIGSALGGGDFLQERSLEGVALASGYWAGERVGKR